MPQQYDADAIFIGTGLIVAGALAAAMAAVLLAAVAVRLARRAIRARQPRRAACYRHDPRDPFRLEDSDRYVFMEIWAGHQISEERARDGSGEAAP